jgi:hypothetical protein
MVPAAELEVVCGKDLPAGVSTECLSQCPWGLFLTASTPLPRIVPKWVTFEQPSCYGINVMLKIMRLLLSLQLRGQPKSI